MNLCLAKHRCQLLHIGVFISVCILEDQYLPVYFLVASAERARKKYHRRGNDSPSSLAAFQQKESGILGKMVGSRSGAGKIQISLKHLLVPDNKKVPK